MSAPAHERYLFKPFYGSSHLWALSHLENCPLSSSVLDIGAGSGAMGETLSSKGFSKLIAVEPDPLSRERLASHYLRTYEALAEVAPSHQDQEPEGFDHVLLLDVLEHIPHHEQFFTEAISRLKPGGTLLLSVPNIAHWSIRLMLFFGRFNYTKRGILDTTHVRFYTRASLTSFVSQFPEVTLEELSGSIAPVELLFPPEKRDFLLLSWFAKLRKYGVNLAPGVCSYQILARIVRNTSKSRPGT